MADIEPEPRFLWLEARIVNGLKVRTPSVRALFGRDETHAQVADFLENAATRRLLVWPTPNGDLEASIHPPTRGFRGLVLYFVKVNSVALTESNMKNNVVHGTFLGSMLLEILSLMAREVYLPLLSHKDNQEGWPDLGTPNPKVLDAFQKFCSQIYMTIGQTQGKTLLPLPPVDQKQDNKEKLDKLGEIVHGWSRHIGKVCSDTVDKVTGYPPPMSHITYWETRLANLVSLSEQVHGPQIRKLLRILETHKHLVYAPFMKLAREVDHYVVEATEIVKFLTPLRPWFERMANEEFVKMVSLFKPMMHVINLIWKQSKYYHDPGMHWAVLYKQICNEIIAQGRKYLKAGDLFAGESADAVERLKLTLMVCQHFKTAYRAYRTKAMAMTTGEKEKWRKEASVFQRLDTFLERCHDVHDLFSTVVQFRKLDVIEVGGANGRTHSMSVRQISSDFQRAVQLIHDVSYDIFDIEATQFDEDYHAFRTKVKELERRLGKMIGQCFKDCSTIIDSFKLIDTFEGLLDRELIQMELQARQTQLLDRCGEDFQKVLAEFESRKNNPPVPLNMPSIAGALFWVHGLVERVEVSMKKCENLNRTLVAETDEGKAMQGSYRHVQSAYEQVVAACTTFKGQIQNKWHATVEPRQALLKQPLLVRNAATGTIKVNFDPGLVELLREIYYARQLNSAGVPEAAYQLYRKTEVARVEAAQLEIIAHRYNHIISNMLEVEKPLLDHDLREANASLDRGEKVLNWTSYGIQEFVTTAMDEVTELLKTLNTIKDNVKAIERIVAKWQRTLLFDRKPSRTYHVLDFADHHHSLMSLVNHDMADDAREIHQRILNSNKALRVSRGAPAWRAYVSYVSTMVCQGLIKTVMQSLEYLLRQVDSAAMRESESAPLLEVKLELVGPIVQFNPLIGVEEGVMAIVNSWINDFYNIAALVPHLEDESKTYLAEVRADSGCRELVERVLNCVRANETDCLAYRETFPKQFSNLWTVDLDGKFREFLHSTGRTEVLARDPTGVGVDGTPSRFFADDPSFFMLQRAILCVSDLHSPPSPRSPTLMDFEQQIMKHKDAQDNISVMANSHNIGWLRIDVKPMKQALITWVMKWTFVHTNFLYMRVTEGLDLLRQFMDKARDTLTLEPRAGDVDLLMRILLYIRVIKLTGTQVEEMFIPIHETIALLKRNEVRLSEDVLGFLRVAPKDWQDIKRRQEATRTKINDRLNEEAEKVRNEVRQFSFRERDFRSSFLNNAPFGWEVGVEKAYHVVDKLHTELAVLEKDAADFTEKQELFELPPSDYKKLAWCRDELRRVKQLWDVIALQMSKFRRWRSTRWIMLKFAEIAGDLDIMNRELPNVARNKKWDAYKGLESEIQLMRTAVPLIEKLRTPAMRDRHWRQLLRETGGKLAADPDMLLMDEILALEIHVHGDAVDAVVYRADQEMAIEQSLQKIGTTWAGTALSFVPFKNHYMLSTNAENFLLLEENLAELQRLQTSEFVNIFISEVIKWQKRLMVVEHTLSSWLVLQDQWERLEGIMSNDDAVGLLPDTAHLFAATDAEWREFIWGIRKVGNVLEATSLDDIAPRLKHIARDLDTCYHALGKFLDSKLKAVPRFYFLSEDDLIDMLSNAAHPVSAARYLPKIMDNDCMLLLTVPQAEVEGSTLLNDVGDAEDAGPRAKVAVGLRGPDGETLEFPKTIFCDGPLEVWVAGILRCAYDTMRGLVVEAVRNVAVEEPDRWVARTTTQIGVLCVQVWLTTEISQCIEAGNSGKDLKPRVQALAARLIKILSREDEPELRRKMTVVLTEVLHCRDILNRLFPDKGEPKPRLWDSMLRVTYDSDRRDVNLRIGPAVLRYGYEFFGQLTRLVVTPLTELCFTSFAAALASGHGGVAIGPVSSGKTETVRDFARAAGMPLFTLACSPDVSHKLLGSVISGMAASGAWLCLDDIHRLPLPSLAVASAHVAAALAALKMGQASYVFGGRDLPVVGLCGVFATATSVATDGARALLPETAALFRPVALIKADAEVVCEVTLTAGGFLKAKILARKIVCVFEHSPAILSHADPADWGTRGVRHVLKGALAIKRAEPDLGELPVVMRAIREFSLPKIASRDMGTFVSLIDDLFPFLDQERPHNQDFDDRIQKVCGNRRLKHETTFVTRVVQLSEAMDGRHVACVVGPPGCGKTTVWKVVADVHRDYQKSVEVRVVCPKAVLPSEVYGAFKPDGSWKDGVVSSVLRHFTQPTERKKLNWLVLDGDVDASWVDQLSSAMDETRELLLASGERIRLGPTTRLIFETHSLSHAAPSITSRMGVVHLSKDDVGWRPFATAWLDQRRTPSETAVLSSLFLFYVDDVIEWLETQILLVPLPMISMVQTLCRILDGLLTSNFPTGSPKTDYEAIFQFACIWAFGAPLMGDRQSNYQHIFSDWWKTTFREVRFEDGGSVFDYFVDPNKKLMVKWSDFVPPYVAPATDAPAVVPFIATAETIRITFLLNLLVPRGVPVMLMGGPGTGKTVMAMDFLRAKEDEGAVFVSHTFNHYTTAREFQSLVEGLVERKAGRRYGPPGLRPLTVFIDDLSAPCPDAAGSQAAVDLMRQHLDHGGFYRDPDNFTEVEGLHYIACVNHLAGAGAVTPRLQRHFTTLVCNLPEPPVKQYIYDIMLSNVLKGFHHSVVLIAPKMVAATVELTRTLSESFSNTGGLRQHYVFSLRELSNVFRGLALATPIHYQNPVPFVRLWLHECTRVYCDRMINEQDISHFRHILGDAARKYFEDLDIEAMAAENPIFTTFMPEPVIEKIPAFMASMVLATTHYTPAESVDVVRARLEEELSAYNKTHRPMELVFFNDAVAHVAHIARLLSFPGTNAFLAGDGGAGKRSLARLAAFTLRRTVVELGGTRTALAAFCRHLGRLYIRAGIDGEEIVFVLSEDDVEGDEYLVYVKAFLATGKLETVFANDERAEIIRIIRHEVKAKGIVDSPDQCWQYFVEKVRSKLAMVLTFSPSADYAARNRRFPSILYNSAVVWFHKWDKSALIPVSMRFLAKMQLSGEGMRENISHHMAFVHKGVQRACDEIITAGGYNAITPKTFCGFIATYQNMLQRRRGEQAERRSHLLACLARLQETEDAAERLASQLRKEEIVVTEKQQGTDKLLAQVGRDRHIGEEQMESIRGEERRIDELTQEVETYRLECEQGVSEAAPYIAKATEALQVLDKRLVTELRTIVEPHQTVKDATAAILLLLSPSSGVVKDTRWSAAKTMLAKVDPFLQALKDFDVERVPPANIRAMQPYMDLPTFDAETIRPHSAAAAYLCDWAKSQVVRYTYHQKIQPTRDRLEEAKARLSASKTKLLIMKSKVDELSSRVEALTASFVEASRDKNSQTEHAAETRHQLDLSRRVLSSLAPSKAEWQDELELIKSSEMTILGDTLLAAEFLCYAGVFDPARRSVLVSKWLNDLEARDIETARGTSPLKLLTTTREQEQWWSEGLPSDSPCMESAAIMLHSRLTPLVLDPHGRALVWLEKRLGASVPIMILSPDDGRFLPRLAEAILNGKTLLLKNVKEITEDIFSIVTYTASGTGHPLVIRGEALDVHPAFRVVLHTAHTDSRFARSIMPDVTLVTFAITEQGLEEELLSLATSHDIPDVENRHQALRRQAHEVAAAAQTARASLVTRLNTPGSDAVAQARHLEELQNALSQLEEQAVGIAAEASKISRARNIYRPVAARSTLSYFLTTVLSAMRPAYASSLELFRAVFVRVLNRADPSKDEPEPVHKAHKQESALGLPIPDPSVLFDADATEKEDEGPPRAAAGQPDYGSQERVDALVVGMTLAMFLHTARAMLPEDASTLASLLALRVQRASGTLDAKEFELLVADSVPVGTAKQATWLTDTQWHAVQALGEISVFSEMPADVVINPAWQEWYGERYPETVPMPDKWAGVSPWHRLLAIRHLRPDRGAAALAAFVESVLGPEYTSFSPHRLEDALPDFSPSRPLLLLLSPTSPTNVREDFRAFAERRGVGAGRVRVLCVGSGSEDGAIAAVKEAQDNGVWLLLHRVDLCPSMLPDLSALLKQRGGDVHAHHRLYLSVDADSTIPDAVSSGCARLACDAPLNMRSSVLSALAHLDSKAWDAKPELGGVHLVVCAFHAVLEHRRRFGRRGWNLSPRFGFVDVRAAETAVRVLFGAASADNAPAWSELRAALTERIYGGHLPDEQDARVCRAYAELRCRPAVATGEEELYAGFRIPPRLSYEQAMDFVAKNFPSDAPELFGFDDGADSVVSARQFVDTLSLIGKLTPRDALRSTDGTAASHTGNRLELIIQEMMEGLPEPFDFLQLTVRLDGRHSPSQDVFYLDCARMNKFLGLLRRDLKRLDQSLRGDAILTTEIARTVAELVADSVPVRWRRASYPSRRPLDLWLQDLAARHAQLTVWSKGLRLPSVVFLGKLFSPWALLAAVMQMTSRKNHWDLDRIIVQAVVTMKKAGQIEDPPTEGLYVAGFALEGARWDMTKGLVEPNANELLCVMPVIHILAVQQEEDPRDAPNTYACPVYATEERGTTFLFRAALKTEVNPAVWTLRGVALVLDTVPVR